jgi:hypothetical protein
MKLAIKVEGEVVDVEPIRAVGLGLVCQIPPGPHRLACQALMFDSHAVDQRAFWHAWASLGGAGQGLIWEDGQPFHPAGAGPETRPRRSWALIRWLRWLADYLDRLIGG